MGLARIYFCLPSKETEMARDVLQLFTPLLPNAISRHRQVCVLLQFGSFHTAACAGATRPSLRPDWRRTPSARPTQRSEGAEHPSSIQDRRCSCLIFGELCPKQSRVSARWANGCPKVAWQARFGSFFFFRATEGRKRYRNQSRTTTMLSWADEPASQSPLIVHDTLSFHNIALVQSTEMIWGCEAKRSLVECRPRTNKIRQ